VVAAGAVQQRFFPIVEVSAFAAHPEYLSGLAEHFVLFEVCIVSDNVPHGFFPPRQSICTSWRFWRSLLPRQCGQIRDTAQPIPRVHRRSLFEVGGSIFSNTCRIGSRNLYHPALQEVEEHLGMLLLCSAVSSKKQQSVQSHLARLFGGKFITFLPEILLQTISEGSARFWILKFHTVRY
jgi:hypothetical protein